MSEPCLRDVRGIRTYMAPWREYAFPDPDNGERGKTKLWMFLEIHLGRASTPCVDVDWKGGNLKFSVRLFNIWFGFYWVYDPIAWEYNQEVADQATFELLTYCPACGFAFNPETDGCICSDEED